jgi:pimeloyl-ACP methyl ester carboxylesterase
MELNWIEIGNLKSNETIIFLHEGLGCIDLWKGYPEIICTKLKVRGIVYDRSGYGKSPGSLARRKANYLDLASEELSGFIDYLHLDNVHLYGHSDGGSIALIFAAQHPNRVKTIITEAAHIFNEALTIKGVLAARVLLEDGKMKGLEKYHGDRFEEVFYAWNDIWLSPSFEHWSIENELALIKCPVLIIQGQDDQYGSLNQVRSMAEAIKGEIKTFTPRDCGHSPFKEQGKLVINAVSNFYNEYF